MARDERETELTQEERERIREEERARIRHEEAEGSEHYPDTRDRDGEYRTGDYSDPDHPANRDDRAYDERRDERRVVHDDRRYYGAARIRGGLSIGSIFTGMAVALGAMFLLTALVGGIAVAVGLADEVQATPTQLGWGLGIALVISQFLAYMWGGYAAGRMARGAGILNGLLVPVLALLLVGLVAAIVAAVGADARFAAPFTDLQIPVEQNFVVQFGLGFGIASLVAMFLGAVLGGALGSRWHDKLEATAVDDPAARPVA